MMQLPHSKKAHARIAGMFIIPVIIAVAVAIAAVPALTQPSLHKIPVLTALVSGNSPVIPIRQDGGDVIRSRKIPVLTGDYGAALVIAGDAVSSWSTGSGGQALNSPVPGILATPPVIQGASTTTGGSGLLASSGNESTNSVITGIVPAYGNWGLPGSIPDLSGTGQKQTTIPEPALMESSNATGDNGAIAPHGITPITYGGSQTYAITPDTGYHIADVRVDDVSIGPVLWYAFTDVQANHTIAALFAINTSTITASAGYGGTVAPSGAVSVNYGSSQTFAILADNGYHTVSVTVDGSPAGAVPGYTFSNVVSFHTIAAAFVADPTITNINPVSGKNGKTRPFTITGTGFVVSGTTRVALYYPGTSTIFVDGDPMLVTSPTQITGQFVLPVSPSHRFYDIKVTNPDGSSDIRPYGFEVT